MTGPTVALIGCGKAKLPHAARAEELYTGPLFRAALDFARRECSAAFVLSAAHGVVQLDQELEPYDRTMADLTPAERVAWGRRVGEQLDQLLPADAVVVALAGAPYLAPIDLPRDVYWTEPLRGLGQGERLAWFARRRAP